VRGIYSDLMVGALDSGLSDLGSSTGGWDLSTLFPLPSLFSRQRQDPGNEVGELCVMPLMMQETWGSADCQGNGRT